MGRIKIKYICVLVFFIAFFNIVSAKVYANELFYLGISYNHSKIGYEDGALDLSDGDLKSKMFSITAGIETRPTFSDSAVRPVTGLELFFDNIDKSVTQGDNLYMTKRGNTFLSPTNNAKIFKLRNITGFRIRAGMQVFEHLTIYGHAGLAYWNIVSFLEGDDNDFSFGNMKVLPIFGFGTTLNINKYIGINLNYMQSSDFTLGDINANHGFKNNNIEVPLKVINLGFVFYF